MICRYDNCSRPPSALDDDDDEKDLSRQYQYDEYVGAQQIRTPQLHSDAVNAQRHPCLRKNRRHSPIPEPSPEQNEIRTRVTNRRSGDHGYRRSERSREDGLEDSLSESHRCDGSKLARDIRSSKGGERRLGSMMRGWEKSCCPNSLAIIIERGRPFRIGKSMVSMHAEENPISSHGSLLLDIRFRHDEITTCRGKVL